MGYGPSTSGAGNAPDTADDITSANSYLYQGRVLRVTDHPIITIDSDTVPDGFNCAFQAGVADVYFIVTGGGSLINRQGHNGIAGIGGLAWLYKDVNGDIVLTGDTAEVTP